MSFDSRITPAVRMPSTLATAQAANESTFNLVPGFCLSAQALRDELDRIADRAMTGLERATAALDTAPEDMEAILSELHAILGEIGHAADATASDIGCDIGQVWGVSVA